MLVNRILVSDVHWGHDNVWKGEDLCEQERQFIAVDDDLVDQVIQEGGLCGGTLMVPKC